MVATRAATFAGTMKVSSVSSVRRSRALSPMTARKVSLAIVQSMRREMMSTLFWFGRVAYFSLAVRRSSLVLISWSPAR